LAANTYAPGSKLDAVFLQVARTSTGTDAWDAAVRDGAALNLEDAIAYALEEPARSANA